MSNDRRSLTKSRIEKAKPPETGQLMRWDSIVSGFGVRCLPGGTKTFVYRYRPRGGGLGLVRRNSHSLRGGTLAWLVYARGLYNIYL
jgi:hypothetical protein